MKLLERLYLTHSPSHEEKKISELVQTFLRHRRIDFETDERGQVFKIIPGRPIISCHMDQVQKGPPGRIIVEKGKQLTVIRGEKDGLGADDKNGIWICLNLLTRWDCSFIFSTAEEVIAHEVDHVLKANESVLSRIPYALVFDRRGKGDIIGVDNDYCTLEFQERVASAGKAFGYHPTTGVFSDADSLSNHMECVNLSVGYHDAHSTKEYTIYQELVNALMFGDHLLNYL